MTEEPTELTITGSDERTALEAALRALLRLVLTDQAGAFDPDHDPATDDSAVPIRGLGADLSGVAFALANDLLAQIDAHGGGLAAIRVDGLLRTTDGYTAWGYLLGRTDAAPPPRSWSVAGPPRIERGDAGLTIRFRLLAG
jgi:hypothetical protein